MRRMITGEQITKINKLNQVDANPTAEATELLDKVQIGDTVYNLAGGVKTVNGQIGNVVLSASDIKADDQTTIQENIDRIDDDIATIEGNIPDITPLATKEELAGKLDKVTTEGPGTNYIRVYTIDNNGNQTITNASSYRGNDCIVIRDKNAQINVPDTPGNKYHATSKKYVDDTIAASIPTNFVTTDTAQTITGPKTFQATVKAPNFTAKGSGESTIYGSTQFVHTFDDNTTLNLKYPVKSGTKTIATVDDLSNMVTTDTEQTITANKTIKGIFSIARANGNSTAFRVYNDQTNQISFAGWKTVNDKNVRTWYNLPLYDTRTTKTIATTDQIPSVSNMVTTDTEQTITADKSIKGTLSFKRPNDTVAVRIYNTSNNDITIAGWKTVNETTTAKTTYKLPLYDTEKYKTIATVDQIPDTSKFVTTDTDQAITGKKTFNTVFGKNSIILGDESEKTNSNMTVIPTGEIHLGNYNNYKSTILNLPKKKGTFTLVTNDDIADMVTLGGNQRITGVKLFDQGYIGITQNMDTGKAIKINADGVIDIYDEGGITNGLSTCHLHFPRTSFTATLATTDQIKTYYKHNITLGRTDNQNCIVQLELITTSSTKMDYAAVVAWMKNNATGDTTAVGCTGFKLNSAGSITDVAIGAYKYSGGDYVRVNWYNPQKNTFAVQNANKFISSSVHEIK